MSIDPLWRYGDALPNKTKWRRPRDGSPRVSVRPLVDSPCKSSRILNMFNFLSFYNCYFLMKLKISLSYSFYVLQLLELLEICSHLELLVFLGLKHKCYLKTNYLIIYIFKKSKIECYLLIVLENTKLYKKQSSPPPFSRTNWNFFFFKLNKEWANYFSDKKSFEKFGKVFSKIIWS